MKDIKIYSSAHCCRCMLVKRSLERRMIPYITKDTSEEENLEFLRKAGAISLPVVVCDDMIAVTPDEDELNEIIAYAQEV